MGFQSGIKEEKSLKMLWNNFKVAFAMYSKIPMPMADWNKENMKYTFCFFPFIGLVIGALSYLVGWAGGKFGFNPSFGNIMTLIPDKHLETINPRAIIKSARLSVHN